MPTETDIPSFASTQLALLEAELKAELEETGLLTSNAPPKALQRAGLAILNLSLSNQRTGFGGKTILELELDSAVATSTSASTSTKSSGKGQAKGKGASAGGNVKKPASAKGPVEEGKLLPEHGIRTGDIVAVQELPTGSAKKKEKTELKSKGVEGVVVRVRAAEIQVACDKEDAEVPQGKLWVVKLANDITYKRMSQTMTKLKGLPESSYTPLMRVLFGQGTPSPVSADLEDGTSGDIITWFSESLNDSQKRAIRFSLASREVALIHGPPGTGKTHTLIELIQQMLKRGQRALVCAPSNIAVDNIVERLAAADSSIPVVRIGHPARLLPAVLNHSLDMLTKTSDAGALVRDVRTEMDAKQASISKTRSGRERRQIYMDLRELRKEYRERERGAVDGLIRNSKVVCATLHGAGSGMLRNQQFDCILVDEASQALEAGCWIPLLNASKVVLAGDHLQLPPTVKSSNSKANKGKDDKQQAKSNASLETTLFDRLLKMHGTKIKRMLTVQYRMHEKIMDFPSQELYEGELKAAEHVKTRLLTDLPYEVQQTDDTKEPLVFWDTQGGDFPETTEDEELSKAARLGESKSNELEAMLVKLHVRKLVEAGVKPDDIAVITPYNAQLAILSQSLRERFPGIELGSVDGFQGREKEAVIVSLVRSNSEHEVGFLGEKRRLNVAMTRPKRHLCVVGDSETVSSGSKFLKRWMTILEEKADLRYPNPSEVYDVDE